MSVSSNTSNDIDLSAIVLGDPILKNASREAMARLLIHVEAKTVEKGELLISENEPADTVHLIVNGEFRLCKNNGKKEDAQVKTAGYIGQEALLGAKFHTGSAEATCQSRVLAIPSLDLYNFAETNPKIKEKFFDSLVGNEEETSNLTESEGSDAAKPTPFPLKDVIGWGVTFILPLLIVHFPPSSNINAVYYMAIMAVAVSMWIFNLVPAFVPPIFALLAAILLDVAPPRVIISGFASDSFMMLLSVFLIGAVMSASGLTYRVSLYILRFLPASPFWYNFGLIFTGLLLTTVVPSHSGRTTIVSPFLVDILRALKPKKNDKMATRFLTSTASGINLLATNFLTGSPTNLIVFGLFTYQIQFAFQWMQWFFAASLAAIVSLGLFFLVSWILFRDDGEREFVIPKEVISAQLKTLGPMTSKEWGALCSLCVLIIGILTTSVHKVEIPWMTMAIFVTLLLTGAAKGDDLRKRIDWLTLLFIAAIISWIPIMTETGIDKLLADNLQWIGEYMKTDLYLFIGLLCISIVISRFILPDDIVTIIFVTTMLPLADAAGVSPWLIGFIILTMSEIYVFPYQMPFIIQLKENLNLYEMGDVYDENRIIVFNIAMIFIRIIAIYASLPFWRFLNII